MDEMRVNEAVNGSFSKRPTTKRIMVPYYPLAPELMDHKTRLQCCWVLVPARNLSPALDGSVCMALDEGVGDGQN